MSTGPEALLMANRIERSRRIPSPMKATGTSRSNPTSPWITALPASGTRDRRWSLGSKTCRAADRMFAPEKPTTPVRHIVRRLLDAADHVDLHRQHAVTRTAMQVNCLQKCGLARVVLARDQVHPFQRLEQQTAEAPKVLD